MCPFIKPLNYSLVHWVPTPAASSGLCRFCIQTARVTWSILNLQTSESPDPTDTDSSHRFTSLTQHGQVSKTHAASLYSVSFSFSDFTVFSSPPSEPSQIEVRLLLAYSSSSTSLSSSSASKLGWSDSIDSLPPPEAAVEGTIPFSKSVKVFIMPKPARRWPTDRRTLFCFTCKTFSPRSGLNEVDSSLHHQC